LMMIVVMVSCVANPDHRLLSDERGISAKEDANSPPESESKEVHSFYVRAVTGPLSGKSVCYVCRHGDRPVVMVFFREFGPEVTSLLKELDGCVNRHRADGLRCFAVMITGTPQREAPRLQTLAFDEKLELPLTISGESIASPTALNIDDRSSITVILYQDRQIVKRCSIPTGEGDSEHRQRLMEEIEERFAKRP
jgi:hypothetical protein